MAPAGICANSALLYPVNLEDLKQRITEYKRSGAYERDVAAVLQSVQEYVERRAPRTKHPAGTRRG
jgi:hypothetical protein